MAPADAARGAVREEFVARACRAHARISHARAIDACLFEPDRQRLQQVDMAFVGNQEEPKRSSKRLRTSAPVSKQDAWMCGPTYTL